MATMTHSNEDKTRASTHLEYIEGRPEKSRKQTIKEYLVSRWTELRPPMTVPPNPFALMRLLNAKQWNFFLVSPTDKLSYL